MPSVGPTEIVITGFTYNVENNAFSLTWGSIPGISYTVERKRALNGAWTSVATQYPAGGATGNSTSYTDNASAQQSGYYRVTYQP
jgi:hypothetical protein